MTGVGIKRRRGAKAVPYKLAASEVQFSGFIDGRRKAIEVGDCHLSVKNRALPVM